MWFSQSLAVCALADPSTGDSCAATASLGDLACLGSVPLEVATSLLVSFSPERHRTRYPIWGRSFFGLRGHPRPVGPRAGGSCLALVFPPLSGLPSPQHRSRKSAQGPSPQPCERGNCLCAPETGMGSQSLPKFTEPQPVTSRGHRAAASHCPRSQSRSRSLSRVTQSCSRSLPRVTELQPITAQGHSHSRSQSHIRSLPRVAEPQPVSARGQSRSAGRAGLGWEECRALSPHSDCSAQHRVDAVPQIHVATDTLGLAHVLPCIDSAPQQTGEGPEAQ